MQETVFYALGGGRGHVNRALAVARALARSGGRSLILSANRDFRPRGVEGARLSCVPEGVREAVDSRLALAAWVDGCAGRARPRAFVVDTFPLGIRNELGLCRIQGAAKRICVLRHVREEVAARQGWAARLGELYDGFIFCEDSPVLDGLAKAVRPRPVAGVGPILIRDAGELPTRQEARRALGLAAEERFVVAVATGTRREQDELQSAYGALRRAIRGRRGVRLVVAGAGGGRGRWGYWPLIERLPAADLVVGPAGYNLFHEVSVLGLPAVWLPMRKAFDDQFWRSRDAIQVRSRAEMLDAVAAALDLLQQVEERDRGARCERPAFANGAGPAAEFIRMLSRSA